MKYKTEYLLNNIIDKNIQDFLLPLNYMQSCFVLKKYIISYNFITPNSLVYNMVSLLGLITVMFLHTYPFLTRKMINMKMSEFVLLSSIFNLLFRNVSYIITYILNLTNGLNNLQLIIKIQRAHRIICIPENVFKSYIIWNWIHVLIKFPLYTVNFLLFIYYMDLFNIYKMTYVISIMYFDCNIIYASRLMKLLKFEMIYLKEMIKKCSKINPEKGNEYKYKKINCKKITQAYVDLISAFDIFKKVFRFSVSYFKN